LDDQIYDYALSLIYKNSLNNNDCTFELPQGNIKFETDDNDEQIMKKLKYRNLLKHKYYTLSFLNKSFSNININDMLKGSYEKYICSENLYTKHAILECAKLEQENEPKK